MDTHSERRRFLLAAAATAATPLLVHGGWLPAALAAGAGARAPEWDGYDHATVIDALCSPGNVADKPDTGLTAADLADARASGLSAVNVTVGYVGSYARDYERAVAGIGYWDGQIDAHPDILLKVLDAGDLATAKRSGRVGLIYGFQDATPLGEDLDRLDSFHGLGLRILQLTYNRRNLIGDGCLEPENSGLSLLGHELVERMNALHMLVDLGHCGWRTTSDAIARSKRPVAISHSGCTAIANLPRNKPDEVLRQLADKDGVIGIYMMPYLTMKGQPMAADFIAHVEHALEVCGEDHVGIGSDGTISGVELTPGYRKALADDIANRKRLGISAPGERDDSYTFVPDLNTPRRYEHIGALLAQRGHPSRVIEKVLGGNFARLFAQAWSS
ncbi:MAG TPA: membrane dipeptidase [Rhodanobacteraceae bacterium]|nr:membrane dipeptidase [Rhodanobacteraceae bacterium]